MKVTIGNASPVIVAGEWCPVYVEVTRSICMLWFWLNNVASFLRQKFYQKKSKYCSLSTLGCFSILFQFKIKKKAK